MDLMLGVLVFLAGAILRILIGLLVLLWRTLDCLTYLVNKAEEQAIQQRTHLDATSTVVLDQFRHLTRGLAVEIRRIAEAQWRKFATLCDSQAIGNHTPAPPE